MANSEFGNLYSAVQLQDQEGVHLHAGALIALARAGDLPCAWIGRSPLFDLDAVKPILADLWTADSLARALDIRKYDISLAVRLGQIGGKIVKFSGSPICVVKRSEVLETLMGAATNQTGLPEQIKALNARTGVIARRNLAKAAKRSKKG